MLAPVTSKNDLREIAAAAGSERYTFVGVRKSAFNVYFNNEGTGSRNGWYNLDGTEVPNWTSIWYQTNNAVGVQAYAVLDSDEGKLDDIENYRPTAKGGPHMNKAVMKCCAKYTPKTFCPVDDP